MPKKRMPREVWIKRVRPAIWRRDGGICIHCGISVALEDCHIDHIISGKNGANNFRNLRTLCYSCHALRADFRHRGMTSRAIATGIIPVNWRELVWDDD